MKASSIRLALLALLAAAGFSTPLAAQQLPVIAAASDLQFGLATSLHSLKPRLVESYCSSILSLTTDRSSPRHIPQVRVCPSR